MRHGLLALLAAVTFLGPGLAGTARADQASHREDGSRLPSSSALEVQELHLADGRRYQGRVESITADLVVFRTTDGETLTIPSASVVAVVRVAERRMAGGLTSSDAYATRLLFGPTARLLPPGKVAITLHQITIPHVQAGASERFSMGGGFLPTLGSPIWLTPKVQLVATERLQAAAGLLQIFAADESGGVAYGVFTYGSPRDAITIGLEWMKWPGSSGEPVLMIGAEHLMNGNLALITENHLGRGSGFLSVGVRFGSGRIRGTAGVSLPLGGGWCMGPIINLVYVR